jgi:4-diphosphocytidyl-2-C-methyl-D-erythritol kinase
VNLPSPAKLNLFLHITGRRPDGYHLLQTLFQLLDIGDDIELEVNDRGRLSVECPGLALPAEQNLAWRAAAALQRHSGTGLGADIRIDKRIPTGGGLGGGSSNAATVLLGLNRLWELGLSEGELARIGLALGADVPLFVRGQSAWAEGVGERLTPVELPPAWYLIIAPDCEVSTAEVFASRELTRNTSPITIATFFAAGARNDCENVVRRLYPEVDNALIWLKKFGQAQLTGTGACVFTTFDSKVAAEIAFRQLPAGWRGIVASGLNRSPAVAALEKSSAVPTEAAAD